MALPGRPPWPLGLRLPGRARARRHRRRRQGHQGAGAAFQAGVPLRLRPGDRRSGLADRRVARAAVRRPRRAGLADPAASDLAAALRPPGTRHLRPDRLHARVAGDGSRVRLPLPHRPDLPTADTDRGTGRQTDDPGFPERSAAPTGTAPRSIRRRTCSTCRRSPCRRSWACARRQTRHGRTSATGST